MSHRDDWIANFAKEQLGLSDTVRQIQEQAIENYAKDYADLNKLALNSLQQFVADITRNEVWSIDEKIKSLQHQILDGFKIPNINERMTGIAPLATGPLAKKARFGALDAITELAKSINTDLISYIGAAETMTKSVLGGIDLAEIRGNGIASALAAIQAEEAKGF